MTEPERLPVSWRPFVLPAWAPVPIRDPKPLSVAVVQKLDVTLPERESGFAAVGLGPVDLDQRWMWRWEIDGVMRIFRLPGFTELYRLTMRPVGTSPGEVRWRATSVTSFADPADPGALSEACDFLVDGALRELCSIPRALDDVPDTREAAIAASAVRQPWPADVDGLARALGDALPQRLSAVRVLDRALAVPDGLVMTSATACGDAVRLDLSDGSLIWLHQPWRYSLDNGSYASDVGGVLVWPGRSWSDVLDGVTS